MHGVSGRLRTTWLGMPPLVQEYHRWCERQAADHRGVTLGLHHGITAWSAQFLASEVERFADERRPLWCTAALANLAELVFCADAGSLNWATPAGADPQFTRDIEVLKTARNVCFHPAFNRTAPGNTPHILQLLDELKAADAETARVAQEIERGWWSAFGRAEITLFVLNRLDSAGRAYAAILRGQQRAFLSQDQTDALSRYRLRRA